MNEPRIITRQPGDTTGPWATNTWVWFLLLALINTAAILHTPGMP